MNAPARAREPSRTVVEGEALAWLAKNRVEGASTITSLPDRSEIPGLGFDPWRAWFVEAARTVTSWVPDDGVAIFYQSDVRHRGAWVDKAHLVQRGAEETGASLLFHKIVLRESPIEGRAGYAHLLAFSRAPISPGCDRSPDVVPSTGHMPWIRAMGVDACEVACRFVLAATRSRIVVDPFCGHGTVLAVANRLGLDALGVDLSPKCCRAARALTLPEGPAPGSPGG